MTEPPYSFEDALDICLTRIRVGESVEACLNSFPEYADELEPMLMAAGDLYRWSPPALSTQTRLAVRAKARAAFKQRYRRRLIAWNWKGFTLRLVTALLLALALLRSGVALAQGSLPGEPLYPVKRMDEVAQLLSAPNITTWTLLQMDFSQRRVDEIDDLAHHNQSNTIDIWLIADLDSSYHAVIRVIPSVDPNQRVDILKMYDTQLSTQQQTLSQVSEITLDDAIRVAIKGVIDSNRETAQKIEEVIIGKHDPTVTPKPTLEPTAVPIVGATATMTVRPTAIGRMTATVQPMATLQPMLIAPATPTMQPTETATATVLPTDTPTPTALPTRTLPITTPPNGDVIWGRFISPTSDPSTSPTAQPKDDDPPDTNHQNPTQANTSTREATTTAPLELTKTLVPEPTATSKTSRTVPAAPEYTSTPQPTATMVPLPTKMITPTRQPPHTKTPAPEKPLPPPIPPTTPENPKLTVPPEP